MLSPAPKGQVLVRLLQKLFLGPTLLWSLLLLNFPQFFPFQILSDLSCVCEGTVLSKCAKVDFELRIIMQIMMRLASIFKHQLSQKEQQPQIKFYLLTTRSSRYYMQKAEKYYLVFVWCILYPNRAPVFKFNMNEHVSDSRQKVPTRFLNFQYPHSSLLFNSKFQCWVS